MLDLLEIVSGICELFCSWRFFLCLFLAFAMIGLVYWVIPNQALCLAISIPVAVVGIGTGIVWQLRKD